MYIHCDSSSEKQNILFRIFVESWWKEFPILKERNYRIPSRKVFFDDEEALVKLEERKKYKTITLRTLSIVFHLPQRQQLHLYLKKSLLSENVGTARKEISSIIKPRKNSVERISLWRSFLTSSIESKLDLRLQRAAKDCSCILAFTEVVIKI